ncbi:MAG: CHAT domain-containing protein [Planctomycetaceae bacterium]|jgi:tetratricopeptide (TPR) repeat protein|nr:CHAT domain-containing protein [Planctomycetaceae bacterium]
MFRRCVFFFVLISLVSMFGGTFGGISNGNAFGQGAMPSREIPTPEYFAISLNRCFEGNFDKALADFNRDLQRAVKMPNVNGQMILWLDSLCYWIMCGECHYQMARYSEAMQAFNNALQIYLQQPEWLKNITYTGNPLPIPRQPFTWGHSERTGGIGNFRNCKFQIYQENVNFVNLGQQGTALTKNAQLSNIRADEIISRMALMIRRRAEILGALSKYDPETKILVEVLGNRPCMPNHFTGVWVDVLYGLTLAAMGDDAAAETQLQKGLLMLGQFDHQLTPVALNELGHIAVRANKPEEAIKYYLESSFSAYLAGDPILLGETFRNMANAQRLIDKTKTFPPIQAALNFFSTRRDVSPMILVPLCHELAEDAFMAGNAKAAMNYHNQAATLLKGRSIADTVHGARNYYLGAMIAYANASADYQNGKPMILSMQNGDKNLETALVFMRQRGSLWLYQLSILETLFQQGKITTRGTITMRIADELYDFMLREPNSIDWILQPMESLAAMTFTPPTAFQRWFFVALQRGDREKAFEISERARRAVFFSSFNLGARLFSLRMLFEGGGENVTQEQILERQTLLLDFVRFGKSSFGELSNQVRAVRTQLQSIPLVPQDPTQIEQQRKLLHELETLSLAQEAMLRPMALTRTQTSNIFPPIMKLEQIRKELPEKTAMLVFTESLGTLYGFLIDNHNLTMWSILQEPRADSLQKLITDYLTALGNRDINYPLAIKDLVDPNGKWKETGAKLLKRLLGNESRPVHFTELVIVPTGQLWYVPFESMTVKIGEEYRPLIAAGREPLTIRYAPMASLGISQKTGRSATAETLVIHGKFVSKDAPSVALDAIDRYVQAGIQHLVPMSSITNESLPSSASAFAAQIKQLLVLDDIPIPQNGLPLSWSPFNGDRTKLRNPVASWLNLPWGGPELIILPGFHTPAEFSLKTPRSGGVKTVLNGEDLFLSAMVLQACGAKTILISRWRTGGRVSYDLVGEFLKNYSGMPSAESWRQAVMTVGGEVLQLSEEPRVRSEIGAEPPMANHPFFWGAFMLIDRGETAENSDSNSSEKGNLDP